MFKYEFTLTPIVKNLRNASSNQVSICAEERNEVDIHYHLCVVYGRNVMLAYTVREWVYRFCEEKRTNIHNKDKKKDHMTNAQCSQMTFSNIRTNAVGKIRTDWKHSVLFFNMGVKSKDFVSTIEIRHTFLNLTIWNYFVNNNHIFKCNSIPYTHTVI